MKKYSRTIKSDSDIDGAVRYISGLTEFPLRITIEPGKEPRSLRQNRLAFQWYKDAERQRIEELERVKREAEEARKAEIAKQEAEAARVAAEQEARERNRKHVGSIRSAAKYALMEHVGLKEEQARAAVLAINAGKIPNIKIEY